MKSTMYSNIFSPVYVLLTGSLGAVIAFAMFTWNYPIPGDKIGQAFISTQPFYIWVFLFGVLFCFLTVFLLPTWSMLIALLKSHIYVENEKQKRRTIITLILEAIFLTVAVFWLLQFMNTSRVSFDLSIYVPQGYAKRMTFIYIYSFLTALPALLGIILIHTSAAVLSTKIDSAGQTEARLFPLIDKVLSYRTLLQNYLTILGIILSMVPINSAGLRAILIALNPANEQNFPITNAILFGLVFTVLLLLIYIPTHLALTEVSRKLRDHLCPLDALSTLKDDMDQRKALDELLQTNIGVTQNLKAGMITLAPLVTSLLASLLNVNINPL